LAAACVTSGEKDIPADLVAELKRFATGIEDLQIIIALDCDAKGQRVSLQIKDTLTAAGFQSVRSVDLGLTDGGDLADFCRLHGVYPDSEHRLKAAKDLRPVFQLQKVQRWQIMHASDLKFLPPVEWLIPGEIPSRSLTVVYGPSGVGKSFKTLDYALRISQNEPVVYMAGEGVSGYAGRIQAWTKHHRQSVGELYMCLGAVSFMEQDDLASFVREVENACKAPALVIVDTLARSMLGADENSTRDMGKFIESCEQVAHYFDCAVMLVHHTNKVGVVERGSGALRGASDQMIKLTDEDDMILVECSKSKDSKGFDAYYMKLMPVDIGMVDHEGNPVMPPVIVPSEKLDQTSDHDLTRHQRKVLEVLSLQSFNFGASPTEISALCPDIPVRGLYRVLSKLAELGFVSQEARREPYVITDSGKAKLGLHTSSHTADTVAYVGHATANYNGANKRFVKTDDMSDSIDSIDLKQRTLLDLPKSQRSHYDFEQ
ncbi:MAG: AAA family ATPase, partial [Anaerolineae bacterium]|nr:AAA family ATPase [Anaerolineae bacterium]